MAKHAYTDDVKTNYHRKFVQILCGGQSVGNDNVDYFYWASAIKMPELVEINLISDDDDSLTDRK